MVLGGFLQQRNRLGSKKRSIVVVLSLELDNAATPLSVFGTITTRTKRKDVSRCYFFLIVVGGGD
jgi:hypothetical protein